MSRAYSGQAAASTTPRLLFRAAVDIGVFVLIVGGLRDLSRLADIIPPDALSVFRLDGEDNLCAWFTSALLGTVGLLMLGAAWRGRQLMPAIVTVGWLVLGIGFLYLTVDEATGDLHEHFGDWLQWVPDPLHILRFRWLLVGFPIAAAVALGFLPMLVRLPRRTATRLSVAGAVYVLGSLGLELLGSSLLAIPGLPVLYVLSEIAEESTEVLGALLALRCMLLYGDDLSGAARS
jgi:hypothetical protein